MLFILLSIIYMLVAVYCSYIAEKADYILPTLVFEPKNKKWLNTISFIICTTLVLIMAIMFFLANQPSVFPNWIGIIVWLIDASCSVHLVDIWLEAIKVSRGVGNKFYGKYNYKQEDRRFHHQLRHYQQKRHHK